MESKKDNPLSTPKRERRRVKTASLNITGDQRSNEFFGGQTNGPSSVYGTPSRRIRQPSVTCGGGDLFGAFPSLNETPVQSKDEEPCESAKVASGETDIKETNESDGVKESVPEQAPKKPISPPSRKEAGSFFSNLLPKKTVPKCVK